MEKGSVYKHFFFLKRPTFSRMTSQFGNGVFSCNSHALASFSRQDSYWCCRRRVTTDPICPHYKLHIVSPHHFFRSCIRYLSENMVLYGVWLFLNSMVLNLCTPWFLIFRYHSVYLGNIARRSFVVNLTFISLHLASCFDVNSSTFFKSQRHWQYILQINHNSCFDVP